MDTHSSSSQLGDRSSGSDAPAHAPPTDAPHSEVETPQKKGCACCRSDKPWRAFEEPTFPDDDSGKKLYSWKLNHIKKVSPGRIVVTIGWGMVMGIFDMSVVSVALLTLASYFDKSESEVQWVSDGYSICLAALSIVAGKVGDKFGSVRVNNIAMLCFMVFSCTCTLAPPSGFWLLIVSRLLQGFSASFLLSTAMSISTTLVEPLHVSKTMSYTAVMCTVATALGPVLGGILTEYCGWQSIFLINVPIGIVGLICTMTLLPSTPRLFEKSFDLLGGILTFLFLALLVFGVTRLSEQILLGVICIVVAIVLAILFCFWERKHSTPVLPSDVLFNYQVMASLGGGIFNFASYAIISYQAPFLLQYSWGYSADIAGLLSLPASIVSAVGGVVAGYFARRYTAQTVRFAGNIISLVGVLLTALSALAGLWLYFIGSCFLSCGMSVFVTANNTFVMVITPVNSKGAMGGAVQCFREAGFSLGIAISCLFNDYILDLIWGEDIPSMDTAIPDDYVWAFDQTFMFNTLSLMCFIWIAATFVYVSGFHPYELENNFKNIPAKVRKELAAKIHSLEKRGLDCFGNPFRVDANGNRIRMQLPKASGGH
eukprot:gnl/Chilomastix_cuspidata/162.p1 GENE.gnl/Chilomastix_cuspidata/162~~gnl/Chilomastix_cuspidata/162.p1  ORF type:complete len:605 (-),score=235.63 gnl/Chilomastix_cuspidata/162:957-2750(-)